ncbi:MAG TPA: hypothetical protein PLZ45_15590 [Ferruginibacter sp.]|nr:hypothetical protein [Ferruginibacter sp.]
MKKLLLASMILMGIGTAANAQTSEAVRAKKDAAKKQANQPVFANAAGETASISAPETDKSKAEAQKAAQPKEAEVKKAAKPAEKKTKQR